MEDESWLWFDLCKKLQEELESYGFKYVVSYHPSNCGADLYVHITENSKIGWECCKKFINKIHCHKQSRTSFIVSNMIPEIKKRVAELKLASIESDFQTEVKSKTKNLPTAFR